MSKKEETEGNKQDAGKPKEDKLLLVTPCGSGKDELHLKHTRRGDKYISEVQYRWNSQQNRYDRVITNTFQNHMETMRHQAKKRIAFWLAVKKYANNPEKELEEMLAEEGFTGVSEDGL